MYSKIEIFLDCGAPSLYNLLSKKKKNKVMGANIKQRKFDDFSYVQDPQYLQYRKEYAQFVKEHEQYLSAYPNLDVINNAELTYKNQKWLEKRGLKPNPVWHFGSDVKWLRRYLDEGYKYICIGGMVPNPTRVLMPALDRIWMNELTDSNGMPKVKVHGFAMTSFVLMYRYPWFSVDSKSWIDYSRFGRVLVPMPIKGKINWFQPTKIAVTPRSYNIQTAQQGNHIKAMPKSHQKYIMDYLKDIGIPFGKSSFKKVPKGYTLQQKKELWFRKDEEIEIIEEQGVCNSNVSRMDANIYVFRQIEKNTPAWPWSLFDKVNPAKQKGLFI